MKGSRLMKAVLAILTFWSPIFVVGFAFWLFQSPLLSASGREAIVTQQQLTAVILEVIVAVVLNMATLVFLSITTIFYGVHILRNAQLTESKKVAWSLVNVTIGPFAMPVYWIMYLRAEGETSQALRSSA